ncbi:acyl carrier protein [Micromonospora sp. WMMD1120]|uniref:acyl carrier protein n=1 Tax=Micromonospora sp. WMMD1120 TaxID=3016106 RepID=UPI00241735C1|nr:acyl carrier protein [Micromonospora sp. WMMD1120]MDG4809354.1 acyl carrier protein [Micromonospora sp. WMMD1120]
MPTGTADRATVADTVKRLAIAHSKLTISTDGITEAEPLAGPLLDVTSLGLLTVLLKIEEELGVTLPDDLFSAPLPRTVGDLVDLVQRAAR